MKRDRHPPMTPEQIDQALSEGIANAQAEVRGDWAQIAIAAAIAKLALAIERQAGRPQ